MSYLPDFVLDEIAQSSRDRLTDTLDLLDSPEFLPSKTTEYKLALMMGGRDTHPVTGQTAEELAQQYHDEWKAALQADLDRRDLESLSQ